jgi:hypothetical protein
VIRWIQWNADAERALSRVEGLDLGDVKREVLEGIAQLWECGDGTQIEMYAVTRVEKHSKGKEWVWLACAGRNFHRFASAGLMAAHGYGLSIRVHVRRPGMRRIYERLGFAPDALTMRHA